MRRMLAQNKHVRAIRSFSAAGTTPFFLFHTRYYDWFGQFSGKDPAQSNAERKNGRVISLVCGSTTLIASWSPILWWYRQRLDNSDRSAGMWPSWCGSLSCSKHGYLDHPVYYLVSRVSSPSEKWNNVGKPIINHPIGNILYHLFIVLWGTVYYCFAHINPIWGLIHRSCWVSSKKMQWSSKKTLAVSRINGTIYTFLHGIFTNFRALRRAEKNGHVINPRCLKMFRGKIVFPISNVHSVGCLGSWHREGSHTCGDLVVRF